MLRAFIGLACLAGYATAQGDSVKVKWIDETPEYLAGVTFGLPWPRGQHLANTTTFSVSGDAELQTWVTAYWPDGTLKWTGHALGASDSPANEYTITASGAGNSSTSRSKRQSNGIQVDDSGEKVVVNAGKVSATCKYPCKSCM
jgi:hypothetical protein